MPQTIHSQHSQCRPRVYASSLQDRAPEDKPDGTCDGPVLTPFWDNTLKAMPLLGAAVGAGAAFVGGTTTVIAAGGAGAVLGTVAVHEFTGDKASKAAIVLSAAVGAIVAGVAANHFSTGLVALGLGAGGLFGGAATQHWIRSNLQ